MTQPPAGWFPDPSDPSRLRYFDGKVWTEHYANFGGPTPPVGSPPPKGMASGKKVALIAGGIVVALFAIGSLTNSDKKDSAASTRSEAATRSYSASTREPVAAPAVPEVAPAGSSVRDGKFEFRVLGVERAASKAGVFNPEPAKGEFFIVNVEVTNIGNEARSFSASSQKLLINGNEYEASSSLSDDNWMENINPGLSITAKVYFDIPKGKVPNAIEFHDSMFSGGAAVAL